MNFNNTFSNSINYIKHVATRSYSANQVIISTCLYIALVCNMPFLTKTSTAITSLPEYNPIFLISVPVFLTCLIILINGILGIGKLLKPLLIIMLLVSSLLFYATATYGIVFDYTMIQNTVETDTGEALTYLNLYAVTFVFLTGVLPAVCIYFVSIRPQPLLKAIISRISLVTVNLVIIGTIAGVFFANYASVGRNNHELMGYITPYKFFDASIKYVNRQYFTPELPFTILDNIPLIKELTVGPRVTVLVVGETARAQNFSLNGYTHNTNKFTQNKGIVSFQDVSSCGTATAVSLPCMFSRLDRTNYDNRHANAQQNLLDLVSIAGMDVLWIDNNNGSCKGVCARVNSIDISTEANNSLCDGEYCLDEALLAPLENKLTNLSANNTLIVLHMMGSHGPTYYKRYSDSTRLFTPDCQRSDIQHCSEQEILNTYDNTIAYTDFVLNKIIERLQILETTSGIEASMLYVSDHGESLGENGVYLHGLPYAFAPKEQTHVPMLFWQSHTLAQQETNCMNVASKKHISHDNLFDLVLGMTSVKSTQYHQDRDVLAKCRAGDALLAANDAVLTQAPLKPPQPK